MQILFDPSEKQLYLQLTYFPRIRIWFSASQAECAFSTRISQTSSLGIVNYNSKRCQVETNSLNPPSDFFSPQILYSG